VSPATSAFRGSEPLFRLQETCNSAANAENQGNNLSLTKFELWKGQRHKWLNDFYF